MAAKRPARAARGFASQPSPWIASMADRGSSAASFVAAGRGLRTATRAPRSARGAAARSARIRSSSRPRASAAPSRPLASTATSGSSESPSKGRTKSPSQAGWRRSRASKLASRATSDTSFSRTPSAQARFRPSPSFSKAVGSDA